MAHILYFTAEWCNPCKKLKPIAENLEREGFVIFQYIDADDNHELCRKFEIRSVPTLIFIENGIESRRLNGATSRDGLLDFINGCN